jgi:competence protein ComGC
MLKKTRNFTVIEIMIVTFVITILIGIGVVSAKSIIAQAKGLEMQREASIIQSAIQSYSFNNNEAPVKEDAVKFEDDLVKKVIIHQLKKEGVAVDESEFLFNSLNNNEHFKEIDFLKLRSYLKGEIKNKSNYYLVYGAENVSGYDNQLLNVVLSDKVIQVGKTTLVSGNIKVDYESIREVPGIVNGCPVGSGTGTSGDPYLIRTAVDLQNIKNNLAAHYKLCNNINMNTLGTPWISMGSDAVPFTGSLDGNNFSIINFSQTTSSFFNGLFHTMSGAIVKNVTFVDPVIVNTSNARQTHNPAIGVLSAFSMGPTTLTNVRVNGGSISAQAHHVGSIVGWVKGGTQLSPSKLSKLSAENITISGNVKDNSRIGGIIGFVEGYTNIIDSFFKGTITQAGGYQTGGIVGQLGTETNSNPSIQRAYSEGTITSGNLPTDDLMSAYLTSDVGGIAGKSYGNITDVYSIASVKGGQFIGGILGRQDAPAVLKNAISQNSVSSIYKTVGGIVGLSTTGSTIRYSFVANTEIKSTGTQDYILWVIGSHYNTVLDKVAYLNHLPGEFSYSLQIPTAISTIQLKQKSTYEAAGWDFGNTWIINEGVGYPKLNPSLF